MAKTSLKPPRARITALTFSTSLDIPTTDKVQTPKERGDFITTLFSDFGAIEINEL